MNLKLYGICFKLRGGPDLLDYVQSNTPVPVDMMGQVMDQVGSVTREELDFAAKLDSDWKKAFNERVPFTMGVAENGGYEITCTVPDGLLDVVRLTQGMPDEKIVEAYTASYLKDVCGIDADIISVDMEQENVSVGYEVPAGNRGFDLSDLTAEPEEPTLDDISEFDGTDIPVDMPEAEAPAAEGIPAAEESVMDGPDEGQEYPDGEPEYPDEEEPEYPDEDPEYPDEESEYPDGEEPEYPDEEEPAAGPGVEEGMHGGSAGDVQDAMTNIYTELVGNIRDRKLDERLGIKIGQQ